MDVSGIIGMKIQCLGEFLLSTPHIQPQHREFQGRRSCSAPLSDPGQSTRGDTHQELGFDVSLRLLDRGRGVSLLKSLTESRGWMREPPGPGSGVFSNPLLPSAARDLPGSQKWGWKTFSRGKSCRCHSRAGVGASVYLQGASIPIKTADPRS